MGQRKDDFEGRLERDLEREPTARRRQIPLDVRGAVRQHFDPVRDFHCYDRNCGCHAFDAERDRKRAGGE